MHNICGETPAYEELYIYYRDLWRLRKEFHSAERKWLKGKIERRKYIRSRNEYKREVEKAKHAFEKDLCAELDELEGEILVNGGRRSRGLWVMINIRWILRR